MSNKIIKTAAILTAAAVFTTFSSCGDTSDSDSTTETVTVETTAVEIIDYSDKYTSLYRDFFFDYTDLPNLVRSQDVMDSASEKGYSCEQYKNESGTSVIISDDLGNRVDFTFSSLDNSTNVAYYLTKDYYIKLDLVHKKYTVTYSIDNISHTFSSLAEAENDFYSRIEDPLVKHNDDYPDRTDYIEPVTTTYNTHKNNSYDKNKNFTMRFGDFISGVEADDGKTLIIKAKISPKYSNESTINQNYYNMEDLILNQGCDKYVEIQYWAVADMSDGSESKVISFTVSKSIIDYVKNQTVVANIMGDYVTDLYIHPSLKN